MLKLFSYFAFALTDMIISVQRLHCIASPLSCSCGRRPGSAVTLAGSRSPCWGGRAAAGLSAPRSAPSPGRPAPPTGPPARQC